jgi:sugar phosphate isomerase/epimerase
MERIIICDNGDFDTVVPFCIAEGLGIELQSFWDPNQPEHYPARIKYQFEKITAIDFKAFHGPFGDLNCGSFDPLIREVSRQRMESGFQTACQLNAPHIIFHHGYVPHTSPPKNWIPRFAQFWKSFVEDKPEKVYFHLENMLELSPDMMVESLDTIADPRVSACLDIGHAHCNSTTPVMKWIEKLGSRIAYVHLHDNNGSDDQHAAIGEGDIPFGDVCNALNECAPQSIWALETHNGIEKSYSWLNENGFMPEGK